MKFALLDVVELPKDFPEHRLRAGMKGVVIEIFEQPRPAYELEFCDDAGRTLCTVVMRQDQLLT